MAAVTPRQWLEKYDKIPDGHPKKAEFAEKAERLRSQVATRNRQANPEDKSVGQYLNDKNWWNAFGRGAGQGATLGFIDEVVAGGRHAFDKGVSYDQALKEWRENDANAQRDYPSGYDAGNFAGNLASVAVPGLNALKAPTLLGRVAKGAGAGVLTEAPRGFGSGEGGFDPRMEGAMAGAALGAAGGAAGPILGRAAAGGVNKASRLWERAMGKGPPRRQMSRGAEREIGSALKSASDYGAMPKNYIRTRGNLAMPGDIPDTALQGQMEAIANMPGEAGERVAQALAHRQQGAQGRITQALDDTMGSPGNLPAMQTTQAKTREQISEAYEELFDSAIEPISREQRLILREAFRDIAETQGPKTAGVFKRYIDSIPAGKPRVRVSTRGDLIAKGQKEEKPLTARQLHGFRGDITEDIGRAEKSGNMTQVRALIQARNAVDDALEDHLPAQTDEAGNVIAPGYADLRAAWQKSKAIDEAGEEGRKLFRATRSQGPDPRITAVKYRGMDNDAKAAFQAGARSDLEQMMETSPYPTRNITKFPDTQWAGKNAAAAFGEQPAQKLMDTIRREGEFKDAYQKAMGNSATARRQATQEELRGGNSIWSKLPGMSLLWSPTRGTTGYGRARPMENAADVLGGHRRGRTLRDMADFYASSGDEALNKMDNIIARQEHQYKNPEEMKKLAQMMVDLWMRANTAGATQ